MGLGQGDGAYLSLPQRRVVRRAVPLPVVYRSLEGLVNLGCVGWISTWMRQLLIPADPTAAPAFAGIDRQRRLYVRG